MNKRKEQNNETITSNVVRNFTTSQSNNIKFDIGHNKDETAITFVDEQGHIVKARRVGQK